MNSLIMVLYVVIGCYKCSGHYKDVNSYGIPAVIHHKGKKEKELCEALKWFPSRNFER